MLLSMLLLSACGGDDAIDPAEAYISAPSLTLIEERRYCLDEEVPECQLERGSGVNIAQNGGVFIWNPSGPVARFDSTGALAARYGRAGEGPGEYRRVFSVHAEADGRVVLYDFGRPGCVSTDLPSAVKITRDSSATRSRRAWSVRCRWSA